MSKSVKTKKKSFFFANHQPTFSKYAIYMLNEWKCYLMVVLLIFLKKRRLILSNICSGVLNVLILNFEENLINCFYY